MAGAAEGSYAAIDLETTGLSRDSDEIIEIAIVRCTPHEVVSRWDTLVKPEKMPSLRVSRLTDIWPEELEKAPKFAEIEEELREQIAGVTPIGHSVQFDLEFLEGYGIRADKPAIDTFLLSQVIDPAAPSHRLGDLCAWYEIELKDAHRALADAEASRRLLLALRERFGELPEAVRADLREVAANMGFTWELSRIITELWDEHPTGFARVSVPRSGRSGEERAPQPPRVSLPSGSLAELTERAFARAVEAESEREAEGRRLQRRDEQLEMAAAVAESLSAAENLIVEAGTGTGKSLAYLVPAALHALRSGERAVVSTHTKNLQEQLLKEDLPRLREILRSLIGKRADELKMAVLKGRGNYLCRRELDRLRVRVSEPDEALLAARATVWASQTETGDKAELRLIRPMEPIWNRISAGDVTCLGDPCEYVTNGSCFLLNAREQAAQAHLIIVNHALLVADADLEMPAIPDAPTLVVDEAQELEGVATAWRSESVDESSVTGLLEAAGGKRGRNGRWSGGLAASLPVKTASELRVAAEEAAALGDALFAACDEFMREQSRGGRDGDEIVLDAGKRAQRRWSEVESRAQPAAEALAGIANLLATSQAAGPDEKPQPDSDEEREAQELARSLADREEEAREAATVLKNVLSARPEETIAWLAHGDRGSGPSIHAAPFSVAEWLRDYIWNRKRTTLLTGATLAHDGGFERLQKESGMEESGPRELMLGSPFDYERQARVYAAADAPPVNSEEYAKWLAQVLPMLAKAAGGRTMVLFTAYQMMRRAARVTREVQESADLALLVQGTDGGPANVVRALINDPKTVVYGVQSLWAGVDVPGEALSQLVIVRLPFPRPNDPVQQGRAVQYDNPFLEQSLPQAITTFRQGFGRLIRSAEDRGVCVILDERIISKRYGAEFEAALPVGVEQATAAEIASGVARFLKPGGDR